MEGIKNYVVSGLADEYDAKSGHAWNKIYLDLDGDSNVYSPTWYMVDLTWCDSLMLNNQEVFVHDYFLIHDGYELINKRVCLSDWYKTNLAANTIFDYYKSTFNKLGISLHSSSYAGTGKDKLVNMIATIVLSMLDKGETCIDFKYDNSLDGDFVEAINEANQKLNEQGKNITISNIDYARYRTSSGNTLVVLTLNY